MTPVSQYFEYQREPDALTISLKVDILKAPALECNLPRLTRLFESWLFLENA